jgi:hypothetical protein
MAEAPETPPCQQDGCDYHDGGLLWSHRAQRRFERLPGHRGHEEKYPETHTWVTERCSARGQGSQSRQGDDYGVAEYRADRSIWIAPAMISRGWRVPSWHDRARPHEPIW